MTYFNFNIFRNEKTYENSTFKVGGASSVSNDKLGYNIKLSGKFLGRKNIRIRPDCTDRIPLKMFTIGLILNLKQLVMIMALILKKF